MSKYGTDERGWPLVPCDTAAIPEGYEAIRVGWAKEYEYTSRSCVDKTYACLWQGGTDISCHSPFLIIRPIPKPIRLPTSIVPHGWWVARDGRNCDFYGAVFISNGEPEAAKGHWLFLGETYMVPPPIAAQLPQEWHALPWDKSAMQQTEGGDT